MEFEVIIEIPKLSMNKYEMCKVSGRIKLDRVLFSSVVYPENYGYFEKTLAEDNDPLDAFVLSTHPIIPGCIVKVRIIGGIEMYDDGERDTKLICVTSRDPRFNHIKKLSDVGQHKIDEIREFLSTYKNLQKKVVVVKELISKKGAEKLLIECQNNYLKKKNS